MNTDFEAKVVVGMEGSVALMILEEGELFDDGLASGKSDLVLADVRSNGVGLWLQSFMPAGVAESEGIYFIKAQVRFYESSSEYFNVKVNQVR